MLLVHILGAALAGVGLALFATEQIRGRQVGTSTASAWKVNLSGPPALLLVIFGAAVFLYPFSPWWTNPTPPAPPAVTTTTTLEAGTTTTTIRIVNPTVLELPDLEPPLPAGPGFEVYFSEECDGDVIEWDLTPTELEEAWLIDVEVYDGIEQMVIDTFTIDTAIDELTFGNVAGLCYWDFIDDAFGLDYYLTVWPYNAAGFADEPTLIHYLDPFIE